MNQLVIQQNGNPVTTSRLVADKFGKQHKDVLKSLKNLECSENFHKRNFALSSYNLPMPNGGSREATEYIITKNGFVFLAMGFTGKEAAKFKEEYIEEFDRRGDSLKEAQVMLSHYNSEVNAKLEAMSRQLTAIESANLNGPSYGSDLPSFPDHATVNQYVDEIQFPITSGENIKIQNAAVLICRKNNLSIKTWEDELTGRSYKFFPKSALHKAVSTVFQF